MPRVLVVDDERSVRELLKVNLELEGYDVVSAGDGAEALEMVESENPDAVVCDLMMPGVDGMTVLRKLRSDPRTAKIPFVVVSAKAMRSDIRVALEAGADRYVTKPFDPQELLNAVAEVLANRR